MAARFATTKDLSDFGSDIVFTHDGARVIAGSIAGEVLAWDAKEGKQLLSLSPNPPTLEMIIASESARVSEMEMTLVQAATELAKAKEALNSILTASVERATTAKAEADRFVADQTAAMNSIQDQVAALAVEAQQATDESAKKLIAEKQAAVTPAQELAAKILAATQQAAIAQNAVLQAVTEQFHANQAAAQSIVTEKESAHKTATDNLNAAKQVHAAVVAEKNTFEQAQAVIEPGSK